MAGGGVDDVGAGVEIGLGHRVRTGAGDRLTGIQERVQVAHGVDRRARHGGVFVGGDGDTSYDGNGSRVVCYSVVVDRARRADGDRLGVGAPRGGGDGL